MKRNAVLLTVAALVVTSAVGRVVFVRAAHAADLGAPSAGAPAFSERQERDAEIKVWMQALAADPTSAAVKGQLAALHLQRAREGGSYDDYATAEQYARESLKKRTNRNSKTAVTLVSALLAQHRFFEAQEVATEIVTLDPEIPQYRSLLGEVAMELGDYATAGQMLDSVWSERTHLSVAPRLARWRELNGRTADARRILETARDDALSRRDVARETKAWFEFRVGDLALRMSQPNRAERAFRGGLKIEPNDPRLLAAMARLSMAQGNPREAIIWGDRAIAVQLDPGTLGVVGDAYAATGDSAKAGEYYRTMEVAVTAQPGPFHRAWSLSLLDRGQRVDEVLAKATEELAQRKDIYAYDLVAWALHCAHRDTDAAAMMRQALRLGTVDPLLARHDREINASLTAGSRAN